MPDPTSYAAQVAEFLDHHFSQTSSDESETDQVDSVSHATLIAKYFQDIAAEEAVLQDQVANMRFVG
jgi:flagellar biosynthesis/type III secretory pathway ATPase